METPVVIVGRGPTGMTVALRLAQQGIESTIIDPQPADHVGPGSKAVLIAQHVADVTWPIGVGQSIVDEGLAWQVSRTFIRGKEVATTDVQTEPGLLPRIVNLPQQRIEELLLERVHAEPLVTLLPECTVTGIVETATDVAVTFDSAEGSGSISGRWVAGCDGARSTVRRLMGIPFEGYGHDDHFLIVDIVADLPFPHERHFHFDPEYNPGRTVLIHPQPGSTWHVDWQVGAEVDATDELTSGRLHDRLQAIVGDVPYELKWMTTYKFKQLKAQQFRKGRTFLVGDAAHLTSPYGARGMNSGVADAEALAWRLALVLNGHAQPSLLDSYAAEREFASSENLRITGKTARFMCPTTPFEKAYQRSILAAARLIPAMNKFVDSGVFYQPQRYEPSDVILPADGTGVEPGQCAGDALIETVDSEVTRLGQLLRQGVVLLWRPGAGDNGAEQARNVLRMLPKEFPITVLLLTDSMPVTEGSVWTIRDVQGLRETWFPTPEANGGQAYIVRPDGHVAARIQLPERSEEAIRHLLGAMQQCFVLAPNPDRS